MSERREPFYMNSYPERDGWTRMGESVEAMSDRLAVARTGASVALGGDAIIAVKTTDSGAFPRGTKLSFIDHAPPGWEEVDRVPWARLTAGDTGDI